MLPTSRTWFHRGFDWRDTHCTRSGLSSAILSLGSCVPKYDIATRLFDDCLRRYRCTLNVVYFTGTSSPTKESSLPAAIALFNITTTWQYSAVLSPRAVSQWLSFGLTGRSLVAILNVPPRIDSAASDVQWSSLEFSDHSMEWWRPSILRMLFSDTRTVLPGIHVPTWTLLPFLTLWWTFVGFHSFSQKKV